MTSTDPKRSKLPGQQKFNILCEDDKVWRVLDLRLMP